MADKLLDFNGLSKYTTKMLEKFNAFVPKTRTINDKPLSDDIKLTYSDVGAQVAGSYVPTSRKINDKPLTEDIRISYSDIGAQVAGSYVPTSRKINDKPLTEDIRISYSDVGAQIAGSYVPTSRKINNKDLSKDITLTASDISGIPSAEDFVPKTRTVNNKALSSDISLNAVDIGIVNAPSNGMPRGDGCIAIGYGALTSENGFKNSIAIGTNAHAYATNAIVIGIGSWSNYDNSIAIGYQSSGYTYSTAIGYNARATESKEFVLGGSELASLKCAVNLKVTSDERDKTDISPIGNGAVEFLKRIKAIRYHRNPRTSYIQEEQYDDEGNIIPETKLSDEDESNLHTYGLCSYDKDAHARGDKKGERIRVGVLAQEVQKALKEVYGDPSYGNIVDDNFYDLDPNSIPEGVENQLSIAYSNFIPFLIKAIQEQDARIDELENEIKSLKA